MEISSGVISEVGAIAGGIVGGTAGAAVSAGAGVAADVANAVEAGPVTAQSAAVAVINAGPDIGKLAEAVASAVGISAAHESRLQQIEAFIGALGPLFASHFGITL